MAISWRILDGDVIYETRVSHQGLVVDAFVEWIQIAGNVWRMDRYVVVWDEDEGKFTPLPYTYGAVEIDAPDALLDRYDALFLEEN